MEVRVPVRDATVTYENTVLSAKGKAGEVTRVFSHPRIAFTVEASDVVIKVTQGNRSDKMQMYTYAAHVKNVIEGAINGFTYELKVCSGHFPMSVAVKGDIIEVKNFLGEAFPRKLKLSGKTKVAVAGDIITVESTDVEQAGQEAARIENITRITNRDRRVFQDGIYITKKAGKDLN